MPVLPPALANTLRPGTAPATLTAATDTPAPAAEPLTDSGHVEVATPAVAADGDTSQAVQTVAVVEQAPVPAVAQPVAPAPAAPAEPAPAATGSGGTNWRQWSTRGGL